MPPYSPDYNPIEEGFSIMKKWMQKNRAKTVLFEDFGEFIEHMLEHFEDVPLHHFYSCYILYDE